MKITYIDHKINEAIRTADIKEDSGKWIIREMIKAGYFIVYEKLPIKIENVNITIINFIIDNTEEIDINFIKNYI